MKSADRFVTVGTRPSWPDGSKGMAMMKWIVEGLVEGQTVKLIEATSEGLAEMAFERARRELDAVTMYQESLP